MAIEEIEVEVRQLGEGSRTASLFEMVRRLLLASIGAVAMTRDETEQLVNRLVERGQIAQKDGERLIRVIMDSGRQRAGANELRLEQFVENQIDQLLGRLNIPSKRDIDELSAKVAQLTARVEELTRKGNSDE